MGGYLNIEDYEKSLSANELIKYQIDEITTLREENAKLSAQVAGLQAAAKAANELYYMVVNFGDFKNGNSYMGIDEGEVMASKVIDKMEQALAALGDAHE